MTTDVIALLIAVLLAGVILGAVFADTLRALWWALADRVRALRGPAPVYLPVYYPAPEHPRYGPLLDTPPQGIEVTRDDGVISVRADLPVQRVRAAADPFTGPMPKLTDEVYADLRAERPPTLEELREQYNRWQRQPDGYLDGVRADAVARADGGETSVAGVLAAEAAPPFPYDPDCDNCAGVPACGSERVFYKWSGMELTMCPRCYVNTFGGEPDPSSVHNVVGVLEAERLSGQVIA